MLRFTPSSLAFRMLRLALRRAFGRRARPAPRLQAYPSLHTLEGREAPGETFAAVSADADFLGLGGSLLEVEPPLGTGAAGVPVMPTVETATAEPAAPAPAPAEGAGSTPEPSAANEDNAPARPSDLPEPGEALMGTDFSLADDGTPPLTNGRDAGGGADGIGVPPLADDAQPSPLAAGPRSDDPPAVGGSVAAGSQRSAPPAGSPVRAAATSPPAAPTASARPAVKTPHVWVEAVDGPTGRGFRIWRDGSTGDLPVRYRLMGSSASRAIITDGNRSAAVVVPSGAGARLTLLAGNGYAVTGAGSGQLHEAPAGTVQVEDPAPASHPTAPQDPSPDGPVVPPSSMAGEPSDGGWSSHPVRYWDGKVWYQTTDLESDGFGGPWAVRRSWSNLRGFANDAYIGNGWVDVNAPRLLQRFPGSVTVIQNGDAAMGFNLMSGSYVPDFFTTDQLTYDATPDEFVLTDGAGNQWRFFNPGNTSLPTVQRGQFKTFTDTYGNVTQVVGWRTDGKPTEVQRSYTAGGVTTTESFLYAYVSSGTNAGLLAGVTLRRKVGSGSWSTVREVDYSYYDGTTANGNAGDLAYAVTKDSGGNTLTTEYYRYYTTSTSGGYVGGLKYAFRPDSYARLKAWADANSTTADAATDTQISPYADHFFQYDSISKEATEEIAKGAGSSANGGQGTFTFAYSYTSGTPSGYNQWANKTVETLPDGNQNIVYTNNSGNVLLSAFKEVATGNQWVTYYHYNSSGRVDWTAYPSAVTGYDDSNEDLLNFSLGTSPYLRDDAGLFQLTDYYTSTTATSTTAGGVNGYFEGTSLRRGELGTAVPQEQVQYYTRSNGALTINPVASTTVYRNDDGTGGQTTSLSYTWGTGFAVQAVTVTYPTVTTGQNGSGTAPIEATVFDAFGNAIWSKDADGYLHYAAFDIPTGAVVKSIDDVDTTQTSTFANLPSGWSTPTGGGLHLTSVAAVDNLGRTTSLTDPNGNVTYYTRNDITRELRTYPGWNTSTNTPTGPTIVSRADWSNGYSELLTMSATPTVSGGLPTGTESISNIQSLSRDYFNAGGQLVNRDQYYDLTGVTYSTSTSLGTSGTNFNRTQFGYDNHGLPDRMVSPAGTIYRTWHDALGRDASEWVGLDDTPTSGTWSPTNTAGTDLVKTTANVYDSGGVGDGNLTSTTDYLGGSAAARESDFYFDWRDRVVAVKDGVETSESTSVNRPIQYFDLDNLGQVTKERTYDGDTVTLTTTSGVPQPPSSSLLRAQVGHAVDELGREYRTQTYSVDPSTGSVSTNALTTNRWFDNRGNTIKLAEPGGLVTKDAYDGAGRLATEYLTDGGGDSGYADASTATGDTVLTQTEWTYDSNSNPILVTTRDRFHDASGTGALGTPTSGVHARVSYAANYFDAADRLTAAVDVGTNGGSAYTRPSSVPSRSDTVLVTGYGYNAAGWMSDVTDPRGIVNKTSYDLAGRVTKTIENYVDGTVSDTDDKTVEYTYNPNGSLKTLTADLTGGGAQTTEYVYGVTTSGGSGLNSNDALGAVKHPDPSTGSASSSYQDTDTVNALGEPLTRTDRNGTVHTYTRDALGRITADAVTTLGTGVDGSVRRIEYAYDGQQNPYLITSYDAATGGNMVNQVKRDFNGLGQLTSDWQEHSGAVTGSSPRVQYAYSEMASGANHSRPTSMTYPNGKVLSFNYSTGLNDSISRLSSLSDSTGTLESYDYLGLDTIVRRAHPQPGVDLTYIKQTGESNGDGGDQYAGLDRFGRVVDQRWLKTSTGTATDRFQYGYDRDSQPLWRDNLVNSAFGELYAYDGLNQLTSFQRGTLNGTKTGLTGSASRSQSWDLDAVGNFDSVTTDGTTVTRTANKQNEITSVSGATTPTYDADGNLTTDEAGHAYKFDAWGRLVQVKDSGGTTLATYAYDGLDRRVSETHGSTTTDLYYSDRGQVVEERVGGTTKVQYVWSPVYVNALVLRDRDADGNSANGLEERLWVEQDADWNVTALVDGSGTVVERYVYDPFGGVTVLDSSWVVRTGGSAYAWRYLWQGERLDPATGLYAVAYRDVSASLGRPLQNDPMGFRAGDVNLYRWEGNRPVAAVDPSGLWFIPIDMNYDGLSADERFALTHAWILAHGGKPGHFEDSMWGGGKWVEDEDPLLNSPDPPIYGPDGSSRKSDLGEQIIEGIDEFGRYMAQYTLEQALGMLLGPVLGKLAHLAIKSGWTLVRRGGKYFLRKAGKECELGRCFAAGTPVRTPDGDMLIEDIRPGDVVLARSEEDPAAPIRARVVEAVFRRTAPVLTLTIGGQQLRLTEEHPFYTLSKGWTPAHDLRAGDWVLGQKGEWLPIGKIEPAGDPVPVYNMRVAGAHTFFVGRERWGFAVWVHNAPNGIPCFHAPDSGGGGGGGASGGVPKPSHPVPSVPPSPSTSPGPGWTWRGKPGEPVGGEKGAWFKPSTKETLHPDLGHGGSIGPHWDWRDPDGKFWRIFPDGRIVPRG